MRARAPWQNRLQRPRTAYSEARQLEPGESPGVLYGSDAEGS